MNMRLWDRENYAKSLKMQYAREHIPELKGMTPEQIYQVSKDMHTAANSQAKAGERVHTGIEREGRPTPFNKPEPQRARQNAIPEGITVKPNERIGKAGAVKSAEAITQIKDAVNAALRKAGYRGPEVEVVNLKKIPKELERLTKSTKALGGYRTGDGKIVLNAIPHDSIADAMFTAFHELFHRGELGTEAKAYLDALQAAKTNRVVGDIVRAIESKTSYRKTEAISEALAEIGAAKKTGDWARLQAKYGVKMDAFSKASASSTLQKFIGKATEFFKRLLGGVGKRMTHEEVHALVDHIYANQNKKIVNPLEGTRASVREEFDEPTLKEKPLAPTELKGPRGNTIEFLKDIRRWGALSNPLAIPKLLGAVGWRVVGSPLEQTIISGLRVIPLINKLAKGSGRYSGFNSEAELAAAKATIQGFKDSWKVATGHDLDIDKYREYADAAGKSGENELGKEGRLSRPILDFWTRLHAAAKTPAKRNEFARSQVMYTQARIQELMREGKTPNHAVRIANSLKEQNEIGIKSYIQAQKAILLGNNELHNAIQELLEKGKASDNVLANALAHTTEFLTPVRKVPLNLATEATEHAFGLVNAISVLRRGVENLSQEQKDYVLRNLSKQTIGAALAIIALTGFAKAGGYYTHNKKDFSEKPKLGDIKTPLGTIPHRMAHAPALEILQTLGNYDKLVRRGQSGGKAAAETASEFGEENVPYYRLISDFYRGMHGTKYERDKYIDDLVTNFTVPGIVSGLAQPIDEKLNPGVTGRKATNLKERLQSKIPPNPLIPNRSQLPAYRD